MQRIYIQIRVHPYNVHWLMGQGLSQSLHVSIRWGKNDFITSIIDRMSFVCTGWPSCIPEWKKNRYDIDQQNQSLDADTCNDDKNSLRVVESGICFHNFRHNNIQIINFNFKIPASHFLLFLECLIVHGKRD